MEENARRRGGGASCNMRTTEPKIHLHSQVWSHTQRILVTICREFWSAYPVCQVTMFGYWSRICRPSAATVAHNHHSSITQDGDVTAVPSTEHGFSRQTNTFGKWKTYPHRHPGVTREMSRQIHDLESHFFTFTLHYILHFLHFLHLHLYISTIRRKAQRKLKSTSLKLPTSQHSTTGRVHLGWTFAITQSMKYNMVSITRKG